MPRRINTQVRQVSISKPNRRNKRKKKVSKSNLKLVFLHLRRLEKLVKNMDLVNRFGLKRNRIPSNLSEKS